MKKRLKFTYQKEKDRLKKSINMGAIIVVITVTSIKIGNSNE